MPPIFKNFFLTLPVRSLRGCLSMVSLTEHFITHMCASHTLRLQYRVGEKTKITDELLQYSNESCTE